MELIPISERQLQVLRSLRRSQDPMSAADLQKEMGDVSLPTIKRYITPLVKAGYVESSGKGRSAGYTITVFGRLFAPIDPRTYNAQEPDAREGYEHFEQGLIPAIPKTVFSHQERVDLDAATDRFRERSQRLSDTLLKKELERFIIELSWKSSRIEGNTYTLLDTERLIREGVEARGHSHEEAVMILNHKKAFEFVYQNREEFQKKPSRAAIEGIHRLLVEDLRVSHGVRQHEVGIVGTRYRPLDNSFQIQEAMDTLREAIGRAEDAYTGAFIALLGISYIQPFEDGNKRTARLLANAILLAHGHAPLSYRSADEVVYREATLVFYETHSLMSFKELFMAQYLFAAEQYGMQ